MNYDDGDSDFRAAEEIRASRKLVSKFTLVFWLNAFAPFLIGLMAGSDLFRFGQVVAATILWLIGAVFAWRRAGPIHTLISGGWVIAIMQFIPILQVPVGMLASWASEQILNRSLYTLRNKDALDAVAGLIIPILTGFPLMCCAYAIGYYRRWSRGEFEPDDDDAE